MTGAAAPVVIAAGGTGGHLFPAEALAQELTRRGHRIVLVTDTRGHEFAGSFPASEIIGVSAATFANKGLIGRIAAALAILGGVMSARAHLRRLRPLAVVGFGGYPSLPAMAAAMLTGRPACLHEQNAVLGRVNRRLAPYVTRIASAFPSLKGLSRKLGRKVVVTGNPLRDAVIAQARAPYVPPAADGPIRVLVFGGSQGARVFAELVPPALARLDASLRARLSIVQQARPEDEARVRKAYEDAKITADIKPFFRDLPERMAEAHLVIARGGAGTICELAAIGRPAIIVPLPSAMDDHQTANADSLNAAGAAWVVAEKGLTPDTLTSTLAALLSDPAKLARAAEAARALGKPEATKTLADLVESLGRSSRKELASSAKIFPGVFFVLFFGIHFFAQFVAWSGAYRFPIAAKFWDVLSMPLFSVMPSSWEDSVFWLIFGLNSAVWATILTFVVQRIGKGGVS